MRACMCLLGLSGLFSVKIAKGFEHRYLQTTEVNNASKVLDQTDVPEINLGKAGTQQIIDPSVNSTDLPVVTEPSKDIPDTALPSSVKSLSDTAATGVLPTNTEVVTVSNGTPAGELDNVFDDDVQPYSATSTDGTTRHRAKMRLLSQQLHETLRKSHHI